MHKVLVVGAGPTGLTAALELARQGLVPEIIEKQATGSGLSRAVGLLPSSMKILEASGVAESIREEAMAYRAAAFYVNDKLTAQVPLQENDSDSPLLYGLAQDRTEALMKSALERSGVAVQHGVNLVSLDIEDDHAVATLCLGGSRKEVRKYDLLVGADGVHSTVRRSLGMAFEGFDLEEPWSIADVEVEGWDTSLFSLFRLSHGKVVVVAPVESGRVRIISNTTDAIKAVPVPMSIIRTINQGVFNISVRQVRQYNHGPVYLAGDAAHCHSPAGGRGMNLGIADAADLAHRIMNDELEGYDAARHSAGRESIALSERARRAMTTRNVFYRMQITTTIGVLSRNRLLRERMISRMLAMS